MKGSITIKFLTTSIIRIFGRSFMNVIFLTNSIIIIIGIVHIIGEYIYGFKKDERFRFIFYRFNNFFIRQNFIQPH